jgi:hypothetical protein
MSIWVYKAKQQLVSALSENDSVKDPKAEPIRNMWQEMRCMR